MEKPNSSLIYFTPAEIGSQLVAYSQYKSAGSGMRWGTPRLNQRILPLDKGNVGVIAALPGGGKTSLAVSLARDYAYELIKKNEKNKAILYVTCDQTVEDIACMAMASRAFSVTDFAEGKVSKEDAEKLAREFVGLPFYISGKSVIDPRPQQPRLTYGNIEKGIYEMEKHVHCVPALIVIDYIQNMPIEKIGKERLAQVSEAMIGARELSLSIPCPILVLVQAGRASRERDIKIPIPQESQWACLTGDTLLTRPDGTTLTIEEAHSMVSSGRTITVASVNSDGKLKWEIIEASKVNGYTPTSVITLTNGQSIRATDEHRFLTPSGYKPLSDIKVGDYLAVPRSIPTERDNTYESMSDGKAKILGLLLGDGCLRDSALLTNSDRDILDEYKRLIKEEWPDMTTRERKQTWWNTYDSTAIRSDGNRKWGSNHAREWLKEIGLFGVTFINKDIPNVPLSDSAVLNLLAGLLLTDGSFSDRGITFASASIKMVKSILRLANRVGVIGTLKASKNKKTFSATWTGRGGRDLALMLIPHLVGRKKIRAVKMLSVKGIHTSEINLLPEEFCYKAIEAADELNIREKFNIVKGRTITRDRMRAVGAETHRKDLVDIANSDVAWYKVKSISGFGSEITYDIQIQRTGTFVANGFVVHNSTIEQEADVWIGIWRPQVTEIDKVSVKFMGKEIPITENLLFIGLGKQRRKPAGYTFITSLDGGTLEFRDMELGRA